MSREWKPGDVAFSRGERVVRSDEGWIWALTGRKCLDQSSVTDDARPLVVIDPEDREQVERLVSALSARQPLIGLDPTDRELVDAAWIGVAQAALREFANPPDPKPDEPTGLGAVVEDRWGHRFVWVAADRGPWWNVNEDQGCTWDHIAAVKVLSEGVVQP